MFWDFWVEALDEKLLKELGFSGACVFGEAKAKELKVLKGQKDFTVLVSNDEKAQQLAAKRSSVDAIAGFIEDKVLREMAQRNIALLVKFSDLLDSKNKARTFYYTTKTVKLARKIRTPIVVCSGAKDKWQLRSVSELVGFGEALGLTAKEAKEALFKFQEKVWKRQELKRTGRYISLGVVKK